MVARLEREAILASRVVHPMWFRCTTLVAHQMVSRIWLLDWPVTGLFLIWWRPTTLAHSLQNDQTNAFCIGRASCQGDSSPGCEDIQFAASSLWASCPCVARRFGGRARLFDETEENRIFGTVSYMPAERLRGHYHLWGPSADLFSLGVMIYRLVTGEFHFPHSLPVKPWLNEKNRPKSSSPVTAMRFRKAFPRSYFPYWPTTMRTDSIWPPMSFGRSIHCHR